MNSSILLSVLLFIATAMVVAEDPNPPGGCDVFCANNAILNRTIGPAGSVEKVAYFFDAEKFPPSAFEAQDQQCTLQAAFGYGRVTITGVVYSPSDSSTGFFINIQGTQVYSEENFLELAESVYVDNGGWIDPSAWLHYTLNSGSLTGFGTYQGVSIDLIESMHPLQVGVGANGKNANMGLSAWYDYTENGQQYMSDINVDLVCPPTPPTAIPTSSPTDAPTPSPTPTPTSSPTDAPTPSPTPTPTSSPTDAPTSSPTPTPTSTPTDAPTPTPTSTPTDAPTPTPTTGSSSESSSESATTSVGTTTGSYTCPPNPFVAEQAIADQYGGNSYFAFIFNTTTNVQYRFNFVNNAGSFQVNTDGSAVISGDLTPLDSNPSDGLFDFDFSAVVNFIPGVVPAEFHKELREDAYVPNGPVDPTTWKFYAFSTASFTISSSAYTISITPYMDMDFQVGAGANGKNVNYGGSSWFQFFLVDNSNNNLVASGVMDINVDLVCESASSSDSSASTGTGSASTSASASASESVGISGGAVTPATSSSPSPSTTAGASTVYASPMIIMMVVLFALALNM